jgi:hypothetical protein
MNRLSWRCSYHPQRSATPDAGFVFLQGTGANGRERIAGFSEQQLATFPFEIRSNPGGKDEQIGFNPYVAESLF